MLTIRGNVYTKDCVFEPGIISIEDNIITDVKLCDKAELSQAEAKNYYIPGLVDVHFHGAAGYDFCDGTKEAYRAIEEYENAHGITTICPATMTLPADELCNIVKTAADCRLASLRGIHLEGPFISGEKKGAQKEDHIIAADAALIGRLDELSG